eukprot:15333090-Ditylum_brightwellii.AAC.1
MECLVLQKGAVHKEGYKFDRVVGSWCHRNYITCSIGMVAMSMMKFLNFWRNIPIIKYGEHEPTKDFPNHEVMSYLTQSVPNCRQWA